MKTLLLYVLLAIVTFFLYTIVSMLYYKVYLSKKLHNGNIDAFKKILGSNYQYKLIHSNAIKYKWEKGWFVVRAIFDEQGNLVESDKPKCDFSKLIAAFYFYKEQQYVQ